MVLPMDHMGPGTPADEAVALFQALVGGNSQSSLRVPLAIPVRIMTTAFRTLCEFEFVRESRFRCRLLGHGYFLCKAFRMGCGGKRVVGDQGFVTH